MRRTKATLIYKPAKNASAVSTRTRPSLTRHSPAFPAKHLNVGSAHESGYRRQIGRRAVQCVRREKAAFSSGCKDPDVYHGPGVRVAHAGHQAVGVSQTYRREAVGAPPPNADHRPGQDRRGGPIRYTLSILRVMRPRPICSKLQSGAVHKRSALSIAFLQEMKRRSERENPMGR